MRIYRSNRISVGSSAAEAMKKDCAWKNSFAAEYLIKRSVNFLGTKIPFGRFIASEIAGVSGAPGVVGPKADCKVAYLGQSWVAWISNEDGIIVTDGHSWRTISDDIRWQQFAAFDKSGWVLTWLQHLNMLRMDYSTTGAATNDHYFLLHLHRDHLKEDSRAKVTGLHVGAVASVATALVAGVVRFYSGSSVGAPDVFLEYDPNTGTDAQTTSAGTTAGGNLVSITSSQVVAQGFKVTSTQLIVAIAVRLKNAVSGTISAAVFTDNASNAPSVEAGGFQFGAFNDIDASTMSSTYSWVIFYLATPVSLSANTQYHFVLKKTGASAVHWEYATGNPYANGKMNTAASQSGPWSDGGGTLDATVLIFQSAALTMTVKGPRRRDPDWFNWSALDARLYHTDFGAAQVATLAYLTGRDGSQQENTKSNAALSLVGNLGTQLNIGRAGEYHEETITHTGTGRGAIRSLLIHAVPNGPEGSE